MTEKDEKVHVSVAPINYTVATGAQTQHERCARMSGARYSAD